MASKQMSGYRPRGIIPPVVTPMRPNEDLDLPKLRWFLDHLIDAGVHAVFVLGTNSEFYALDDAEKQAITAAAMEQVRGRCPVLVGVGAETTREVIRLTRMAEREGADAVTVITPYFVQPNPVELYEHYRRVAEHTSLPVVLYNNPGPCGVRIPPEVVAELADLPNIAGIKDSSGDLQNSLEYQRLAGDRLAVLQGRDTLIYSSLDWGLAGAVPAAANVAPRVAVEIFEAFHAGDRARAMAAQKRLDPVRRSLALGTPPSGPKAALRLLGIDLGPCRAPLLPWTGDQEAKMLQALQAASLLHEDGHAISQ